MESKLVKGLFLAGELLDADGYTGGFNLQIAWATGHCAGCDGGASCDGGVADCCGGPGRGAAGAEKFRASGAACPSEADIRSRGSRVSGADGA